MQRTCYARFTSMTTMERRRLRSDRAPCVENDVLRAEGTPIDDHRSSAAYRAAMLGQSLRKLYAESPEEVSA